MSQLELHSASLLIVGTDAALVAFAFRALELLVFFPAEENVFRLKSDEPRETNAKHHNHVDEIELAPEPIPEPFTFAKLYWGMSLVWSWRGVGWNYCCPLPYSAQRHPYTRTSSRREYLKVRLINTVLLWIAWDIFRTITNLSSAAHYLSPRAGIPAPAYRDWSILEKALCSIIIPARIVIDTEKTHLMMSVVFVSIGGYMGWEGEIWSPYGWPPLFGSFGDLFTYPGLAMMWSRVGASEQTLVTDGANICRLGKGTSEDGYMSWPGSVSAKIFWA